EVRRVCGEELDVLPRGRMRESQAVRVKPLPREPEPGRQRRVGAVERITDAGMTMRGHVHADLVRAPRLKPDLQERGPREGLKRLVVRDRCLALGRDGELPGVIRMPADGRIDRAGERVGMTLDDSVVDLLDRALLEG